MFGRIMPAPLLIPVTVTVTPSCTNWRLAPFGRVSVVMMPAAAAAQLSTDRSSSAACRAPSIFSTGSGSPITPVEYGSTWLASTPASCASLAQVYWRSRDQARLAGASVGIAGVGQQVTNRAGHALLGQDHRRCAEGVEGEHHRRTVEPSAQRITTTSLRPGRLMPAEAIPSSKPATGVQCGQRTKTNSHECAP